MELNQFIANFAEQLDDTNISLVTPTTNFRDLDEWSSLVALLIIGMVDEEYDVAIGAKEIMAANTIEELFELVKNK